jgi:undecaprenyl-diphosphatase
MSLDISIFNFLNGIAISYPWLSGWIVFFAKYFPDVVFAAIVIFVIFLRAEHRKKALLFFTALGAICVGRFVAIPFIHTLIERPRPFVTLPALSLLQEPTLSFPSGHATIFFALATSVFLFNKKWGVFFFAAALIIAAARVMAGLHYPTDIFGGAVLGTAVGYSVFKIFSYLNSKMI